MLARRLGPKESYMKMIDAEFNDDLRPEYDETLLKGGLRGKYVQRYNAGTNIIFLDADVAMAFPNSEAVNQALRLLMAIARTSVVAPTDATV